MLHKSVSNEINKVCRTFLWIGQFHSQRSDLITWDKLSFNVRRRKVVYTSETFIYGIWQLWVGMYGP